MFDNDENTILYKCPYCVSGRFTAADGWDGAKRHIKENHMKTERKTRRRRVTTSFLEDDGVCYSERELAFAPA